MSSAKGTLNLLRDDPLSPVCSCIRFLSHLRFFSKYSMQYIKPAMRGNAHQSQQQQVGKSDASVVSLMLHGRIA